MGTDHPHRVCTFQEAEETIRGSKTVFVNDCFCRRPAKEGKCAWEYCGHEVETCMSFAPPEKESPDWPIKEIGRDKALEMFEAWKTQGTFFRFMMDDKGNKYLCLCCSCGCGWCPRRWRAADRPAPPWPPVPLRGRRPTDRHERGR